MKILHYALGFPPYRSGGLTKFCMDIMKQQKKDGNEVALLWPGQMKIFDKVVRVKKQSSIDGITSYEIINPLPVSYDEGIADIKAYTLACDKSIYIRFLKEFCPDIIHIHTLMGMHKEVIEAARDLGIRTVFTTHDFFPICPKVTMFRNGCNCTSAMDCSECSACNTTALSLKKLWILQSPIYRVIKNNSVIKFIRKKHRDHYLSESTDDEKKVDLYAVALSSKNDYQFLRKYYRDIIEHIDIIHYNSTNAKSIYEKFFQIEESCVVGITHADIVDERKIKEFSPLLRISYLGPQGSAKGYFILKNALDHLWEKHKKIQLNVFFQPVKQEPYMKVHDKYCYQDLESILDETDVVVTPSVWNETFGFTVLEAICHGVPVVISDTVGAKDILPEGAGIIIKDIDSAKLEKAIDSLSIDKLAKMNNIIISEARINTIEEMCNEIMYQCYK